MAISAANYLLQTKSNVLECFRRRLEILYLVAKIRSYAFISRSTNPFFKKLIYVGITFCVKCYIMIRYQLNYSIPFISCEPL